MRTSGSRGWLLLVLFLIIGAVFGGVVGEFLATLDIFSGVMPYLNKQYVLLNIPPLTVDLYIAKIVGGLIFQPSLMSIIGMLLGIYIYSRF